MSPGTAWPRSRPVPEVEEARAYLNRNTQSVLVVDDEPLNIKLMRGILSQQGFEVLEARNGREALTRAGQNPI